MTLVTCTYTDNDCISLLNELNYPLPSEETLVYFAFKKNRRIDKPVSFTFEGSLQSEDNLINYITAIRRKKYICDLKSENYLADPQNTKTLQRISYKDLFRLSNQQTDILVWFTANEYCGNKCEAIKRIMSSVQEFIFSRGFDHLISGIYDVELNSLEALGIHVKGKGVMRYYKEGDLENYQDIGEQQYSTFQDLLAFILDVSSKRINILDEDLEDL